MPYQNLIAGERLQKGDEYCTTDTWKEIPSCMIGDKIPDSKNTQWRRLISDKPIANKKSWFSF